MTLFCFLSRGFTVVLLELDEDLDVVFLLGVYDVHDLDLLQSLESVDKLLCDEDLLCGMSQSSNKYWSMS